MALELGQRLLGGGHPDGLDLGALGQAPGNRRDLGRVGVQFEVNGQPRTPVPVRRHAGKVELKQNEASRQGERNSHQQPDEQARS